MEILIIGGALVALMVYASTRIKKSAARAYEREIIETESFNLVKPEGFIVPVNENSEYAFEARSKDYSDEETHDFPKADIKLKIFSDSDFEIVCQNARDAFDKVLSEEVSGDNSRKQKICFLKGEKMEDETPFNIFHKIVQADGQQKIYDLKISVLRENREQLGDQISETISGFRIK
jgi:hypothetical protein